MFPIVAEIGGSVITQIKTRAGCEKARHFPKNGNDGLKAIESEALEDIRDAIREYLAVVDALLRDTHGARFGLG